MRIRARSAFDESVEAVVRAIPRGQTLSYAGVALRANKPGAARAVVRALYRIHGAPWWRVIRSDGTLAKEVAAEQAKRLRAEGVKLTRASRRASGGRLEIRVSEQCRLPPAGGASISDRARKGP